VAHFAQAVTVDGYGEPEIIVMARHFGGSDIATRFPIPSKIGPVEEVANLDGHLSQHAFRRTGDWEPTPYGSLAPVRRTHAVYDFGTEDRAAYVAVMLESAGFRIPIPQGSRLSLIEQHLDYLRRLRLGVEGHADERDAILVGSGRYFPEDYDGEPIDEEV
jgi:hypothetical protein